MAEIKRPGQLIFACPETPLNEVCFMRIKERGSIKERTVDSHMNSDCCKTRPANMTNTLSKKILEF